MINSVSDIMSLVMGSEGKKTDDLKLNPGGFEALLSLLLSQGMARGADNLQGLEKMLAQGVEGIEGFKTGNQDMFQMISGRQSLLYQVLTEGMEVPGFSIGSDSVEQEKNSAKDSAYERLSALFTGADDDKQEEIPVPKLGASQVMEESKAFPETSEPAVLNSGNETVKQKNSQDKTERTFDSLVKPHSEDENRAPGIQNQKLPQVGEKKDVQYIVQRPETLKMLKYVESPENPEMLAKAPEKSEKKEGKAFVTGQREEELPRIFMRHSSFLEPAQPGKTADKIHIQGQNDNLMRPVEIDKDNVMSQIFDRVKVIKGSDMSEVNISLKPESLGQVTIRLVMEKGVMAGKILVENSGVKNLIETNLPQIRENLKGQNIDVSTFTVSVNLGHGNMAFNQGNSSGRWSYNKKAAEKPFRLEAVEEINIAGSNAQMGLLNLLA